MVPSYKFLFPLSVYWTECLAHPRRRRSGGSCRMKSHTELLTFSTRRAGYRYWLSGAREPNNPSFFTSFPISYRICWTKLSISCLRRWLTSSVLSSPDGLSQVPLLVNCNFLFSSVITPYWTSNWFVLIMPLASYHSVRASLSSHVEYHMYSWSGTGKSSEEMMTIFFFLLFSFER